MIKKITTFLAMALFVLATAGCLFLIHSYRDQFTFVGDDRYEKTITRLDLSGAPIADIHQVTRLQALKTLDVRGTGITVEEYEILRAALPQCKIDWDVPFQGQYIPNSRKTITLTTLSEEDVLLLDYFPNLRIVYARECRDYAQLDALRLRRPECRVNYYIEIGGRNHRYTVQSLETPGDDLAQLESLLPYFPDLESITLTSPLAPMEEILALREAHPEVSLTWTLDYKGVTAGEFTESLDLTGIPTTVEEIENLITYLPHLTFVDMSDCGISNEEMDALNFRYENIKIIWTVKLGSWYRTKTDITWFMPYKNRFFPRGNDLENLRYCHDIIALDIGHMDIASCEFVAYMPHLQYLLLADTKISDLTPLTGLTELKHLELFLTKVTDYSPLLTLTALEDLNLHYTLGDPKIIAQMTWLKNLWWNTSGRLSQADMQLLRTSLPDCHFEFWVASSTGGGWRNLPNYYAQRDIFGMSYLKG